MQSLRDSATVAKELPAQSRGQSLDGLAVVSIAWRQSQGQSCALIMNHEVQFEPIEPPHGGLPTCGQAFKDFMGRKTVVITDGQGRRGDEGDAGVTAFAGGERAT